MTYYLPKHVFPLIADPLKAGIKTLTKLVKPLITMINALNISNKIASFITTIRDIDNYL